MDQASYADVLPDMASGYMLFQTTLDCLPEVSLTLLHAYSFFHPLALLHLTLCKTTSY